MAGPPRDLIFDLDGTLIDSAPDLARALNRLLAELGRPPLEIAAVRRLIGDGAPELVRRVILAGDASVDPAAMPELVERYRGFYLETATHLTRTYPGVVETLTALRDAGHRMVVCTNKIQTPTMKILDHFGLTPFFDGVAGGDATPARKPDPRHILAALALAKRGGEHAAMIGDGINDARAAQAAGIPVVLLDSGYGEIPAAELGGDALIASFSEIPVALRQLDNIRQR